MRIEGTEFGIGGFIGIVFRGSATRPLKSLETVKNLVLAAVALSLLVLPASGGPRNDYAAATVPIRKAFAHEATMTSMFEIEAARMAGRKPTHPVHNIFADVMTADGSKMLDELTLILADFRSMRLPFRLDAEHRRDLPALRILSGRFSSRSDTVQTRSNGTRTPFRSFGITLEIGKIPS